MIATPDLECITPSLPCHESTVISGMNFMLLCVVGMHALGFLIATAGTTPFRLDTISTDIIHMLSRPAKINTDSSFLLHLFKLVVVALVIFSPDTYIYS
jgi:hypothetical protein